MRATRSYGTLGCEPLRSRLDHECLTLGQVSPWPCNAQNHGYMCCHPSSTSGWPKQTFSDVRANAFKAIQTTKTSLSCVPVLACLMTSSLLRSDKTAKISGACRVASGHSAPSSQKDTLHGARPTVLNASQDNLEGIERILRSIAKHVAMEVNIVLGRPATHMQPIWSPSLAATSAQGNSCCH